MFDFNLHYFSVGRHLLLQKEFLLNSFNLPMIKKFEIIFFLNDVEDFLSIKLSNYQYFFKFFFGKFGYLFSFTKNSNQGNISYNMIIKNIFLSEEFYSIFFFLSECIFSKVKSNYITLSCRLNNSFVILENLELFLEIKNNAGLFYLKDSLYFNFFYNNLDSKMHKVMLSIFKIYI